MKFVFFFMWIVFFRRKIEKLKFIIINTVNPVYKTNSISWFFAIVETSILHILEQKSCSIPHAIFEMYQKYQTPLFLKNSSNKHNSQKTSFPSFSAIPLWFVIRCSSKNILIWFSLRIKNCICPWTLLFPNPVREAEKNSINLATKKN